MKMFLPLYMADPVDRKSNFGSGLLYLETHNFGCAFIIMERLKKGRIAPVHPRGEFWHLKEC